LLAATSVMACAPLVAKLSKSASANLRASFASTPWRAEVSVLNFVIVLPVDAARAQKARLAIVVRCEWCQAGAARRNAVATARAVPVPADRLPGRSMVECGVREGDDVGQSGQAQIPTLSIYSAEHRRFR
jgi:hypothetical protein